MELPVTLGTDLPASAGLEISSHAFVGSPSSSHIVSFPLILCHAPFFSSVIFLVGSEMRQNKPSVKKKCCYKILYLASLGQNSVIIELLNYWIALLFRNLHRSPGTVCCLGAVIKKVSLLKEEVFFQVSSGVRPFLIAKLWPCNLIARYNLSLQGTMYPQEGWSSLAAHKQAHVSREQVSCIDGGWHLQQGQLTRLGSSRFCLQHHQAVVGERRGCRHVHLTRPGRTRGRENLSTVAQYSKTVSF